MGFKKRKLPGMTSGDPGVYKRGRTRTQDSKYRDVYGSMTKERGNKPVATSKGYIPYVTAGIGVVSAAIMYAGLPMLGIAGYNTFMASPIFEGASTPLDMVKGLKWWAYGSLYSVIPLVSVLGATGLSYGMMMRNWRAQNVNAIHTDIDMYESDAYIQQPIQLPYDFDIFPDAGAHSKVSPTAVLAHMMFSPKGLQKVELAERVQKTETIEYDDGSTEKLFKGEIVLDRKGEPVTKTVPIIDKEFGDRLFTDSFIPEGKAGAMLRQFYDTSQLMYNPTGAYGKLNDVTVQDHIKKHWTFPVYETQRPAGAYIVDTEPNNTMVLAMTRAGKGQTIIEPTIDMWTREDNLNNMAINDPKGELYVKFYYAASKRGYDVVPFNLINPSRTNIYNPLGYAVEAARQGDNQKVEELVASIGDVFFPTEKADDPMWPNAANAAFKRSALGLIDFYQEEEREISDQAVVEKWNPNVLSQRLDELWGRVTLYNVYQMMTELASKKSNDTEMIHLDDDDPSEEKDYLTLFFDATNKLPKNALRTSTANQDNSLRAMAGSDKTIASVYGISLTAMLFFTDDKISRLTSGRPSQNFDMVGLGFPRRLGVRIAQPYMNKKNLRGQRTRWTAYKDKEFTEGYMNKKGEPDADFMHESRVDSNGWCFYFFKGIFENMKTYLKLELFDDMSGLLSSTYYFEFTKGFQMSMNGRSYVKHPVHKERIIHNGILREMKPDKKEGGFKYEQSMMKHHVKSLLAYDTGEPRVELMPVFTQNEIHYTEKPKAVFFLTPPHLMSYAKIILILINQMFNMQVDKAYLTKANQKPMLKTRYMLDEVGNLQSEGNGIPYLSTKESIGLGQEQQYTLILQTLQQLKDVYGDSVDKILQGNTGNILYLKSTDDSMLDTLEKMAGTRHEAFTDSKSTSMDLKKAVNSYDGLVSLTTSMKEVPTISKNDMLFIPKSNAMVFGKGNPIWARNELVLPMSHSLHKNQLHDVEKEYVLETVPTTMNTDEFDVIANKPNFMDMVAKRVSQAKMAESVRNAYKDVHGLDEDGMSRISPEELSKSLMKGINGRIHEESNLQKNVKGETDRLENDEVIYEDEQQGMTDSMIVTAEQMEASATSNEEFIEANDGAMANLAVANKKIYAQGQLSRHDLKNDSTSGNRGFDYAFSEAFARIIQTHKERAFAGEGTYRFDYENKTWSLNDGTILIESTAKEMERLQAEGANQDTKTVRHTPDGGIREQDELLEAAQYNVKDALYAHLVSLDSWQHIVNGMFDAEVSHAIKRNNSERRTSDNPVI